MADPTVLGYIGATTGVIGAITGIAGAFLGFIGYRRAGQLKALDLRLELGKAENELRATAAGLASLIQHSLTSRKSTAAAMGQGQSSVVDQWVTKCNADTIEASQMMVTLASAGADFAALSHAELETRLVKVHETQLRAGKIECRHQASMADDQKLIEQIRATARAHVTR